MSSAIKATISWTTKDITFSTEVFLRSGSLLVSQSFLQNLLEPGSVVTGLEAVIEGQNEEGHVAVVEKWDTEGQCYFQIDESLALDYKISFHMEKEISDSGQKIVDECIEIEGSSEDMEPSYISIIPWIRKQSSAHRLHKFLDMCGIALQVQELPITYDGNKIFELPPAIGKQKRMEGMEQRYDGHLWSRPSQTNMAIDCTVRLSSCLGSLKCQRQTCAYYLAEGKFNETFFHGYLDRQVNKGYIASEEKSSITCHYCQKEVTCFEICTCKIYYILPAKENMSRLAIHIGEHMHSVPKGTCRANIAKIRKLVSSILAVDHNSGPRKIQMITARELLLQSFINEQDCIKEDWELQNFLEELMPLIENQRYYIVHIEFFFYKKLIVMNFKNNIFLAD